MAAITDGVGSSIAPAGTFGRPTLAAPPRPIAGRGAGSFSDAGAVGRFGDLGRLWEGRGRAWAEAVRIHQLDRRLGRFAERVTETQQRLEQVKLYPPYPINESRRAEAIRQFNGLAAEALRLIDADASPGALPERASTAEAEAALVALGTLGGRVARERAALATKLSAEAEVPQAELVSGQIGHRFAASARGGLSGVSVDVLRQIA